MLNSVTCKLLTLSIFCHSNAELGNLQITFLEKRKNFISSHETVPSSFASLLARNNNIRCVFTRLRLCLRILHKIICTFFNKANF
jgi:hypothetical protein